MSRIRTNQITNQSADGAPTVQNGLVISGVTTSTTFSGSGASLTNLPSAQLTGALPALDGSNLTGISGVTINSNADNRIITGSGSANTLNGEANLTYNGSSSLLGNLATSSTNNLELFRLENSHSDGKLTVMGFKTAGLGSPQTKIYGGNDNSGVAGQGGNSGAGKFKVTITNPSGTHQEVIYAENDANTLSKFLRLSTNGSERLRITSGGSVGINTTAPESNSNDVSLHIHGSANDDARIAFSTPTKSNPGSRIGYYGLNRFGIDTYDGIEMRDVTRSYATIFKIDQNGYMTTNQPYGHLRFEVENDTGGLVVQSNVNTADIQNGMSHNGSGRLTVPVAGKYLIMIGCNILDNSDMQFRLRKNGSDVYGTYFQNSMSDVGWKSGSRTTVLPLSANDYLQTVIQGKQDGPAWNHFTVYLLG
tara:strand:+ start:170 stop:1432 length:1263 start_codon:yes stop_codon:yes gene_type:complete